MKGIRKFITAALCVAFIGGVGALATACGGNRAFDPSEDIIVVQREAGSGTRESFEKAFGLTDKVNASLDANTTGAVFAMVSSNEYAIGYVSSGLITDDVKGITVDGNAASDENIVSGAYAYQRPFHMITKKDAQLTALQQDFLNYVYSNDGQAIVKAAGFVQAQSGEGATDAAYSKSANLPTRGKLTITGSTSVQPVMNQLIEAYKKLNADITFECSGTGSGQGKTDVTAGTSDFGIISSALTASEQETFTAYKIATDGIALVVNNSNPVTNLTGEQVVQVFGSKKGSPLTWSLVIA